MKTLLIFLVVSLIQTNGMVINVEFSQLKYEIWKLRKDVIKIVKSFQDQSFELNEEELQKINGVIMQNLREAYEIAKTYLERTLTRNIKYNEKQHANQLLSVDCSSYIMRPLFSNSKYDLEVHLVVIKDIPKPPNETLQQTLVCNGYIGIGSTRAIIEINIVRYVQSYKISGDAVTNADFYNSYLMTATHELLHALGLNPMILDCCWVNVYGDLYTQPIIEYSKTIDNKPNNRYPFLSSPAVYSFAKQYFENDEILGVPLEVDHPPCGEQLCKDTNKEEECKINQNANPDKRYFGRNVDVDYDNLMVRDKGEKLGLKFHWEQEFLGNEIMTPVSSGSVVISKLTYAALLDTGFYSVIDADNFDTNKDQQDPYATNHDFGKGMCKNKEAQRCFIDYQLKSECNDASKFQYDSDFNTLARCSRMNSRYNEDDADTKDYYENKLQFQILSRYKACDKNERPFQIFQIDKTNKRSFVGVECFQFYKNPNDDSYKFFNLQFNYECLCEKTASGAQEINSSQKDREKTLVIYCSSIRILQLNNDKVGKRQCEQYCGKKYICVDGKCLKW